MYFIIAAYVAAVAVGIGARINHCVIECGVEHRTVVSRSALDTDARESLVPAVGGTSACLVETETGNLGIEIAARSFHIDERQAHLDIYLLALFSGELGEKTYVSAAHGDGIAHDTGGSHTLEIGPAHHVVALA